VALVTVRYSVNKLAISQYMSAIVVVHLVYWY